MIRYFPWYGGKLRVANEISMLIPEHRIWYEPFMGSAVITLNHKRSEIEVINDLDTNLVCLMKTMADREKGKELVERLCRLWYGKGFFEEAMERKKKNYRRMDDIDKAVMEYILITQSFNNTRKQFRYGIETWEY